MGGDEQAKDGTAQIDDTWGCVASPNGGLEPAPGVVIRHFTTLDEDRGLTTTYTNNDIPGTVRIHDIRVQPLWNGSMDGSNYVDHSLNVGYIPDAVMLAVEFFTNENVGPGSTDALARNHTWWLCNQHEPSDTVIGRSNGGVGSYTDQITPQFMWAHVVTVYSSYGPTPNPELPGMPFAAWTYSLQYVVGATIPDASIASFVQYYGDPTSATQPNATTYLESSLPGWSWMTLYKMVSHNDRLVLSAALIPPTGFTGHVTAWATGETKTDDTLFFHGINNVQDVASTNLVQLTSDIIDGIGAITSGPANQLFIVRNHDGGLIISGSMENPTIDRYPGVEPTGGYVNNPCVTPLGVVYGTASGVFAWPGGDHATQLSKGLEGGFWFTQMQWRGGDPITTFTNLQGREHRQPHTSCGTFAYRHPFIYCPNNYIFDIRTGGWFRIIQPETTATSPTDPRSGITFGHWAVGYQGVVYGAQTEVRRSLRTGDDLNADVAFYGFDPAGWADEWIWTSQPLVRGRNRILKVREVDLVASGIGTIDVTVTGINGATQTTTYTVNGELQMIRKNFNVDAYDAVIQFHATGNNIRLHRASLGYRETRSTNAT